MSKHGAAEYYTRRAEGFNVMGFPRRLRGCPRVADSQRYLLCPYCIMLRAASERMDRVLRTVTHNQVGGLRMKIKVLGLFDRCTAYYSMVGVYFILPLPSITPNETPCARCFQQSFRIEYPQLVTFLIRLEISDSPLTRINTDVIIMSLARSRSVKKILASQKPSHQS